MATAVEIFAEALRRKTLHGVHFGIKYGAAKDEDGTFISIVRVLCTEPTCMALPDHGFDIPEAGFLDEQEAYKDAERRRRALEADISKWGAERVHVVEQ